MPKQKPVINYESMREQMDVLTEELYNASPRRRQEVESEMQALSDEYNRQDHAKTVGGSTLLKVANYYHDQEVGVVFVLKDGHVQVEEIGIITKPVQLDALKHIVDEAYDNV